VDWIWTGAHTSMTMLHDNVGQCRTPHRYHIGPGRFVAQGPCLVQEGGVVKAKPMPARSNRTRSVSVYVASRELYRSFWGSNTPPFSNVLVAGKVDRKRPNQNKSVLIEYMRVVARQQMSVESRDDDTLVVSAIHSWRTFTRSNAGSNVTRSDAALMASSVTQSRKARQKNQVRNPDYQSQMPSMTPAVAARHFRVTLLTAPASDHELARARFGSRHVDCKKSTGRQVQSRYRHPSCCGLLCETTTRLSIRFPD
jgi:hypothetical protein